MTNNLAYTAEICELPVMDLFQGPARDIWPGEGTQYVKIYA